MKWSVISGGAWLAASLVIMALKALAGLHVISTIAYALMALVMVVWAALTLFAPFGLAYASWLTIRCIRQSDKDAWQRSDARDALRLNLLAWIFSGFPSLLMSIVLPIVWFIPNS